MSSTLMNSSGAFSVGRCWGSPGSAGDSSPMYRGSDDYADADDEAAQDDAEGGVLVVLELLAQREGQHLHEHEPYDAQDDQAQDGEDGGDEELVEQLVREHHLPPWKPLLCR